MTGLRERLHPRAFAAPGWRRTSTPSRAGISSAGLCEATRRPALGRSWAVGFEIRRLPLRIAGQAHAVLPSRSGRRADNPPSTPGAQRWKGGFALIARQRRRPVRPVAGAPPRLLGDRDMARHRTDAAAIGIADSPCPAAWRDRSATSGGGVVHQRGGEHPAGSAHGMARAEVRGPVQRGVQGGQVARIDGPSCLWLGGCLRAGRCAHGRANPARRCRTDPLSRPSI
jgi:hypothetical protein